MLQFNDNDTWNSIDPEHLWVTDKLILAKRLGYSCGPAGVPVPYADTYIVRPCVNYRMMSRGATEVYLTPESDTLMDGYFWCEKFTGRHLSFDYTYGEQVLAVEGFRNSARLDRFCRWEKVTDKYYLTGLLYNIAKTVPAFNVEVIGDKVIEVHFRHNDDFLNHNSNVIFPVWKDCFYKSECGDRLGFILG